MPCLYQNCGAAAGPETQNWTVGQLCTNDYQTIAALYPVPAAPGPQDDFVKVHVLLQYNTALCLTKIGLLNTEMGLAQAAAAANDPRFAKGANDPTYLKLSRALEYYEGLCWFPANRTLLGGLLSADAFHQSLKLGLNKDPGAGRAHGDQSHRLQWHVIMRCITNDFQTTKHADSGWSYTPLELFYAFTQGPGGAHNSWSVAMDSQSNRG